MSIFMGRYCVNQNPREASSRSRIFLNSLVYLCMCVTSPGQTKNDTDLKFGTHTPIDYLKTGFSSFRKNHRDCR